MLLTNSILNLSATGSTEREDLGVLEVLWLIFQGEGEYAVAVRVVAVSPEFATSLQSFLLHSSEHRLAASGASWCALFFGLDSSGCKAFGGHVLGEAAILAKTLKPASNLSLEHFVFAQA